MTINKFATTNDKITKLDRHAALAMTINKITTTNDKITGLDCRVALAMTISKTIADNQSTFSTIGDLLRICRPLLAYCKTAS